MSDRWTRAGVGLGGNLGDVTSAFATALGRLDADPDLAVVSASSLWLSAPCGLVEQPDFLNAVALVDTRLDARGLLVRLQREEADAGRERSVPWGPRLLDLDLLWYGDTIVDDPDLRVPHPRLADRSFVLEPALELRVEWSHPKTGRSLWDMREHLKATSGWTRCERVSLPEDAACRS